MSNRGINLKNWILNIFLCIGSTLFTFILIECSTRFYYDEYSLKNFLGEEKTLFSSAYPSQYDPYLGWIPQEGFSGRENVWRTKVTIGERGIRSNGKDEIKLSATTSPILAVGDSLTFGDEVSDHESWPAILEKLLDRKVLNAGVFGYGVDQIYLRTEQLLKILKPRSVIFSFCYDDILRCEFSERTAVGKPFFKIEDNRLVQMNVPVPRPSQKSVIGPYRHFLGYSYFIHKLMMSRFKGYWLQGKNWLSVKKAHSYGNSVACMLFRKFDDLIKAHGIKEAYILVQYTSHISHKERRIIDNVLPCIKDTSLKIVDLRDALIKTKKANRKKFDQFYNGPNKHMSYEGNYFVAGKLQDAIKFYNDASSTLSRPGVDP